MVLLGERLSAQQALTIGLVSEGGGDLVVHCSIVWSLQRQYQKQSPSAVESCELIMAARDQTLSEGYALERERFIQLWQDANQFEGVSAFIEKRPPQWQSNTEGNSSEQ